MKAIEIVRRIDAGVIITPKPKKRINTEFFTDFVQSFSRKQAVFRI